MLGLLGSHRVGKSTLAKAFAMKTGALNIEMNISKIQKEIGYDSSNQSYDFDTRMIIQEHVLKRLEEIYAEYQGEDAVCDRTPLDLVGYTMLAVSDSLSEAQGERLLRYIEDCITLTNKVFTAIVLVQPGIPLSEAVTSAKSNLGLMEKLNLIYLGLITDERTTVPHFYIPKDMTNLDHRLKACDLALAKAKRKLSRNTSHRSDRIGGIEFSTATYQ
jgi:hypothetical protein